MYSSNAICHYVLIEYFVKKKHLKISCFPGKLCFNLETRESFLQSVACI